MTHKQTTCSAPPSITSSLYTCRIRVHVYSVRIAPTLCYKLLKFLQKMFGIYLHALTLHAPLQYEILCLKSAITENEERLFGQAKNMVHSAANRQPTTVIPNILLRFQARQKKGNLYKEYYNASNRISKRFSKWGETHKIHTYLLVSFLLA